MATIHLQLSDEMKAGLEARAIEAEYSDVAEYLRDLIQADLQESWEMTPELASALAEGEASGTVPYDFQSIVAEARAKFRGE